MSDAETLFGKRIVQREWRGQTVEVVEDLWVFCRDRAKRATLETPSGPALEVWRAAQTTEVDELGIGVIDKSEALSEIARALPMAQPETGVLWEEPLMVHRGSAPPNDPRLGQQWGLSSIHSSPAFNLVSTGDPDSVLVAVLDTGMPLMEGQKSHPDLDGSRFVVGGNFISPGTLPRDDHGHGTHTLGILGAETNNGEGVAGLWHRGRVMAIKVLSQLNAGSTSSFLAGVLEAVRRADQEGANLVINYSAGGIHPVSEAVLTALGHASRRGALIVAAAGNNGLAAQPQIDYPARHSTEFSNVIAVGAVMPDLSRFVLSSTGPSLTVVAPGDAIVSTLPNYPVALTPSLGLSYGLLSGTSQAAPYVSALAALIWSQQPSLSAAEVRQRIIDTADPLPAGSSGFNQEFGFGLINVERALA